MPLALRATLVNGVSSAGDPGERRIYEGIKRVLLAPQGICVLDSTGRVLVWVQMFENQKGVLDFFDHALKRYSEAGGPTECYLTFPGNRVKEVKAEPEGAPLPDGHARGAGCPAKAAKGRAPAGSLAARLVGRALDEKGKPLADTVNQEHYVEDKFTVPPGLQEAAARALAAAGTDPVRLPDELSKLLAGHAFLGHIDVGPFLPSNKGEWKRCELLAWKAGAGLFRVEGESEVAGEVKTNGPGVHDVKLAWEGFIEMKGDRMARLVLSARGTEKLQFAKDRHPLRAGQKEEVAGLPGGRPIDLEGAVRYGILAEPVAADETPSAAPEPGSPPNSVEEKMRRVQEWAQKRQEELQRVAETMHKFAQLMQQGKIQEAEAVLDETLKLIEGKGAPVRRPEGGRPALHEKMQRLQEAVAKAQGEGKDLSPVGRIMEKFEPLMKEGKHAEAEALIDEALKLAEGK